MREAYDVERVVTVDKILVKGVGVDRSTNDDFIDYIKISNMESVGVRQFIHKYDMGMQDHYYFLRYQDDIRRLHDSEWARANPKEYYATERRVRDGVHALKREMLMKQFRWSLRVTLQMKDGVLGKFDWDAN